MLRKILAMQGADNGFEKKNRVLKERRGNNSPIFQYHFHFAEISVIFPIFWVLVFSPRDPNLKLLVPFSQ